MKSTLIRLACAAGLLWPMAAKAADAPESDEAYRAKLVELHAVSRCPFSSVRYCAASRQEGDAALKIMKAEGVSGADSWLVSVPFIDAWVDTHPKELYLIGHAGWRAVAPGDEALAVQTAQRLQQPVMLEAVHLYVSPEVFLAVMSAKAEAQVKNCQDHAPAPIKDRRWD